MKSLAWKLATLAAVVGIGFLVLLQAQRGMNQALLNKQGEAAANSPATAALADTAAVTPAKSGTDAGKPEVAAELPTQSEPQPNAAPKPAPTPAAPTLAAAPTTPTLADAKPDPGPKPLQTAEVPTKSRDASAAPQSDPFADSNDPKQTVPAAAAKPGEVKQTSATGEENGPKADPPTAKTPAENPPALVVPGGQAEPTAALPPDRIADPKSPADPSGPGKDGHATTAAPKDGPSLLDSNGPQLLAPNDGQPPAGPTDQKTGAKPDLKADGKLDSKRDGGSTKANSALADSAPFPSLDDPPAPSSAPAIPEKPGVKSPAGGNAPTNNPLSANTPPEKGPASGAAPGHPDPFPLDADKEVPLKQAPSPKLPDAQQPDPKLDPKPAELKLPDAAPAGSNNPSQQPPRTADSSAPAGAPVLPPPAGRGTDGLHSEPPADFQGDGTVGEQAPLGPQRPQLNIEKVAPQNALLGQPLIYSILVKNVGNSEAHDVVVEDRIPKGSKLSGTIPRAELTGKKLVWRMGNLGPGEQRKISIRVIPLEAGEIGSVATVNFVSEAAAETVVTAPRLEFELSAPRDAKLGRMVPFHFKVKNVGTGEARGVVIRDLIPAGLAHAAGNDLEYELGQLPPGKWKELTLELKATKVGTTVNKAVVVGEGGLSVKAEAAIEVSGSKIALSRSGPARRYLGRPTVYSNTLVNESKDQVDGIVAVETVPPGMEFLGASHGGQYNEGTRTIAWRIERMAPGETRIIKSKLVPKTPGAQNSTVRISVPDGEPSEATSETIVEGFAAFGLDVTSAEGPVDVGEKVTLRVNARNKGSIAATNVVVTVEIPDQLTILSIRGPGQHAQEGNRVRFGPMPTLEGRTAATCEIVLQATKRGDNRLHITVQGDQINKPLTREESILVLSESSEPAASR